MDIVREEAKNALLEKKLKTKKNKFSVSLNAPENPKTQISFNVNLGGKDNQMVTNHLVNTYNDTCNHLKEFRRFSKGQRNENDDTLFAEV